MKKEKLAPFHVTVLIYMTQSGVIVFSLTQLEAYFIGTNGWLVALLFSIVVVFNLLLIGLVYRLGKGRSIFEILEQSIPQFILIPLYLSLAVLWAIIGCLVAKEYVLIFQMVAFPTTNPMVFKIIVDILAYFLLIKGIYNISKAATVFFWLSVWMNLLLFYFFWDFKWSRLTPFLFQEGHLEFKGLVGIYAAFIGYELTLLLFEYSDSKTKLIRSAILGNTILTVSYLCVGLVTFGFFSFEQLQQILLPLLDLMAYIKLPFVERVENLLYGVFLFAMIATLVMYMWSASEASERVFRQSTPKVRGFILLSFSILFSFLPETLTTVKAWLNIFAMIETGVAWGLPVLLLTLLAIQKGHGDLKGA